MLLRRSLSLVLLVAHASAAVHLALGAHAVSDSGAVVEAAPECVQPGHGSSGLAHGHELSRHENECEAAALLRAVAQTGAPADVDVTVEACVAPALAEAAACPPLAVLSVAPKSSPPV